MRRFLSALWLALALVVGQHAAAVHELGHATEQLSHKKGSKPAPLTCDECFACATLSGAVGASLPSVPEVVTDNARPVVSLELGTPAAARLAFRSRAPPLLPA